MSLSFSPYVVFLKLQFLSLSLSLSAFEKPASWNILFLLSVLPLILHSPRAAAFALQWVWLASWWCHPWQGFWMCLLWLVVSLLGCYSHFYTLFSSHITNLILKNFILNPSLDFFFFQQTLEILSDERSPGVYCMPLVPVTQGHPKCLPSV